MRLVAYAKLLNRKINSAHKKAKNPFFDGDFSLNPFREPIYNTIVWVESDSVLTEKYSSDSPSRNRFESENNNKIK